MRTRRDLLVIVIRWKDSIASMTRNNAPSQVKCQFLDHASADLDKPDRE